ncbi:MAG: hypothetical protein ABI564_04560 [Ideonella sp.]
MPTTAPQQLDIFLHSHDVMLRNDVLGALERREAVDARARLRVLASEMPADPNLPALEILTLALETDDAALLADHEIIAQLVGFIANQIEPAARQLMGQTAGEAWVRPTWRDMAARCRVAAFQAHSADCHAAALWLRAKAWNEAAAATQTIESWRRIPAPLVWMTEARCRLGEPDQFWPLLAELAWLSPSRLDALLRRLEDPRLEALYKQFGAAFDGTGEVSDLAWFPAWVAVEKPMLATHLAHAQAGQRSSPEQGMRLVLELLRLERHGRHQELVERRKSLRDLHPGFFAQYMRTR